jgi:hypothetical protein
LFAANKNDLSFFSAFSLQRFDFALNKICGKIKTNDGQKIKVDNGRD